MAKSVPVAPEIQQAYQEWDRTETIYNFKVACCLGLILMPAGVVLDHFIYPDKVGEFLKLRLLSDVMIAAFLTLLLTPFAKRHYRFLGIALAMLPSSFISIMIYRAPDGASSPYYAGLNLILLVVAFIMHWTFLESLVAVTLVIAMYLMACLACGFIHDLGGFFNNVYFLVLTGIIVVTGRYFHSKSRFNEFAFRYQLDKSRQELAENNRQLIELDRLKSRFFANISHELRTPLTLLLAPLETLIQKFDRTFDDNSREMLRTMQANGMRLLKLINDLLDLIRLESGRLELKPEPLGVSEFINGLASAVRQVASHKHIAIETHVDAQLDAMMADHDKLEKIALNLLFNAVKFTPENGRIWLRAEKQDNEFVLIVRDNGVGIAEKSLRFVFDRFWQEDGSSKRKFQGVGIGLALVKELSEIQGGTVTVDSEEGKGATFTVRLPYQKAEPPPLDASKVKTAIGDQPAATEEWVANLYRRAELFPAVASGQGSPVNTTFARKGTRPVVLVADDEPDMRTFLKSQLVQDYEVIEADDGLQAEEKAQEFLPDIILLDLMMPHKDGLQVCRELREYASTSGIPIILLTARADEEAKFDALQIGANDFLAKPFSSIELQARIKNLIESHHYQRKLTKQNQALTSAIEQIKETEMQLVQSEKLASLGRLSAGIIHEINNPLNFANTGVFALRSKGKKLPPEDRGEYEAILNDVEEGLKRVRNIVSDLRTFTHPGGGTSEPVEVADIAAASLRFLAGEWKDKVQIHQSVSAEQLVWANRNKLIHVLVNLLQNSIDALQEKNFAPDVQPTIWIEGRVEGDRSLIIVRDNGPGIEPQVVDKIFDPFFTTKEVGKGMGLGLSICYRIVQGYGGKIAVNSKRGENCEFILNFPASAQALDDEETENGKSLRL